MKTNFQWIQQAHGHRIIHGRSPSRTGDKPARRKPKPNPHGIVKSRPDLVAQYNANL